MRSALCGPGQYLVEMALPKPYSGRAVEPQDSTCREERNGREIAYHSPPGAEPPVASHRKENAISACIPVGTLIADHARLQGGIMRRTMIGTRAVPVAAIGLVLAGAACSGTKGEPANSPFPSGEPVAIGYAGITSGPPGSVASDRQQAAHATRIEDLLAGHAGLRVHRLGNGRVSVQIRGPNSFLYSSEPLLVIDGMPVQYDSGSILGGISPSEVVRIQVLKDDASTAIFGLRGANGVIMITTRRAR